MQDTNCTGNVRAIVVKECVSDVSATITLRVCSSARPASNSKRIQRSYLFILPFNSKVYVSFFIKATVGDNIEVQQLMRCVIAVQYNS